MERRFAPDRAEHDLEDPDLGAAAMDDNTEPGGGQKELGNKTEKEKETRRTYRGRRIGSPIW